MGVPVGVDVVRRVEKLNRVAKRPGGWHIGDQWMDNWQSQSVVVLERDVSV